MKIHSASLEPPEHENCPDCEDGVVVEVEDGVECSEGCGFGSYRPEPDVYEPDPYDERDEY